MTNEEKAKELGIKYQIPCHGVGDCEFEAKQAALEMAEWKERQMINKACEWLELVFKDLAVYNCGGELINDFIKAMNE